MSDIGKDIKELISFNNSDEIMNQRFGHLKDTKLGFLGLVS